ncbi:O-antigen ligase family protein [Clostridium hydrogenum]|uniref:O-antigen ligase family protein n=1 Tax=Clostridium hydrogenum TaxID=2855764 RepID=UPI001F42D20D|nr:O-antigen ligase family protein [Clostridium hydrogenum]
MLAINKKNYIYLAILVIFTIANAVISGTYITGGIFVVCSAIVILVLKPEQIYENLIYTLIITSVMDYTFFIHSSKLYVFHFFLVITTLVSIFKFVQNREKILKTMDKKIAIFFVIWLVYMCLSVVWSASRTNNIKYIAIYIMMFAFVFDIVVYHAIGNSLNKTIKVFVFMFCVSVIVGMFEILLAKQLPVQHYYDVYKQYKIEKSTLVELRSRPIAFFFNTNNFGTFLTIGIPFLLTISYFIENRKIQIISVVAAFISFVVLVLTASRTNYSVLMLILAVYSVIILYGKKSKSLIFTAVVGIVTLASAVVVVSSKFAKYGVVIMIAFAVVYAIFIALEKKPKVLVFPVIFIILFLAAYNYSSVLSTKNDYRQKVINGSTSITDIKKGTEIGRADSIGERLTVAYDVVSAVIKQKHFLGVGVGNSSYYVEKANNTHKTYDPHGWFIELFGDFGILFFVLYIAFYAYLLKNLFDAYKTGKGSQKYISLSLFLALGGFIFGSFSPSSVTYFLPHWLLYGLCISCINNKKKI